MTGPHTPSDADDPTDGDTMAGADELPELDASEDDPTARMEPVLHPHGGDPAVNPLAQG